MTAVIGRAEGHYERQSMSYGQAYVWRAECVVVECDCGERLLLGACKSVCSCGTDHGALMRKVLASRRAPHPWEDRAWREWQDEYIRSESDYWLEWTVIE